MEDHMLNKRTETTSMMVFRIFRMMSIPISRQSGRDVAKSGEACEKTKPRLRDVKTQALLKEDPGADAGWKYSRKTSRL
ncbi:hypothetical protein KCP70_05170 [Salmonella enterica subsp. enterica]|nr:hypothetical protein KCP70_05170 [Salmonella enterica subsp. enterica]